MDRLGFSIGGALPFGDVFGGRADHDRRVLLMRGAVLDEVAARVS